ncbi:dihydroxyacetone kinase subunit DhaK [Psychromonas sp. CNPT3]|uniref:dihydroxyacetone kinase subunit DhaK n=1 Tax=Psychromonas sp. CNPT3 TaxID=314282 RepID=UPI00006E8938|nr:dihydroxyacetone kinase subunit DhaK [Psychromonas sp. CNPT3]AGH82402.1 dihydroxyacetone kinase subunit DhaK [Psychromonas sp. CNPT3]
MKKFINKVEDIVTEQLEGLYLAHPDLKVSTHPRYIWRDNNNHVALIAGGGNGHEPMHAGYIGKGMLTGACPGEVFTSPTPDQMYECGQQLDNGHGILFFIKNYTSDVLNFETAVEMLHFDGVKVGAVLIDDDVAVKDSLYTSGRRGVAGTVIIEKVVGAAAEQGYDLTQCELLARRINNGTRTFGVALTACTVPATGSPSFILADNEIEFGVGIHGESGIERRQYTDLNSLVEQMLQQIINSPLYTREIREWDRMLGVWQEHQVTSEPFSSDDQYIVLVNGLGATPNAELYGVFRCLHQSCQQHSINITRNLIGNYCTSLDMEGFSITFVKVDKEILTLWDAPVNTPALRWGC